MKFYENGLIFDTGKSKFLFTYSRQCSSEGGRKWICHGHIYLTDNNRLFIISEDETLPRCWRKGGDRHIMPNQAVSTTATNVINNAKRYEVWHTLSSEIKEKLEDMLKEA